MKSWYAILAGKILIFSLLACALVQANDLPGSFFTGKIPVMQSYTDDKMVMITTLRSTDQNLSYELSPGTAMIKVKTNDVGHNHFTDTLDISGLQTGVTYNLLIRDTSGQVIDSRRFHSIDENKVNPKTAVCSCSRVGILSPDDKTRSMWDRLLDQKPDAILFLGDIVYGDNALQAVLKFLVNYHPKFEQIQKRFIQSWKKERIYHQENLTPLFAIWDDHDFGFEASDKTNPYKHLMLTLFRAYYPIPTQHANVEHGPGAAYSFRLFGKKIVMLDNRSFYSLKGKSLLGMPQIQWLENQIKGEKEVVISSGMSLIDTGTAQESLQRDAASEWSQFKKIFEKHPVKAVFLTGDVHFSEVRLIPENVLGFRTYQLVSSPIKSTTPLITPPFKTGKLKNDPNQLAHVYGYNFAILMMGSLFQNLEVEFHRRGNKPPVELVSSFEGQSCQRFFSFAQ